MPMRRLFAGQLSETANDVAGVPDHFLKGLWQPETPCPDRIWSPTCGVPSTFTFIFLFAERS